MKDGKKGKELIRAGKERSNKEKDHRDKKRGEEGSKMTQESKEKRNKSVGTRGEMGEGVIKRRKMREQR